jgi:catalase
MKHCRVFLKSDLRREALTSQPQTIGVPAMSDNRDMIVTIGEPGDPENDPTKPWPPRRRELKAGTLEIAAAMPQESAGGYNINYHPLVMGDGIRPSDDPILLFRSPSYALSFTKRIRNL